MIDREKVLNALRCHAGCERGFDCGDCAYIGNGDCLDLLAMDAYALLKEQEAVEPYQHDAVWLCGNCEKEVVGWHDDIDGKEYRYPFCRQCGKAVKWK
jgi:hypothetical protein